MPFGRPRRLDAFDYAGFYRYHVRIATWNRVRHFTDGVRYSGDFYGQGGNGYPVPEAIGVESLLRIVEDLPAGITELACHPGDASGLDSMYRAERMLELRTLCDPRVREAIARAGFRLASFAEVAEELSLRARASSSA